MEKKKLTEGLAEITASSAKKVKEVAADLSSKATGLSKEKTTAIHKDVDALVDWVAHRNDILQQENTVVEQTKFEDLPVLGKVIFGGEVAIKKLPDEERNQYAEYFKKNGARITVLTAVNPLFGLGVLGVEAAASGLVSAKASVGTTAVGAGLVGLSKVAIASIPSSASVSAISKALWYVPGLQYVGVGLFALGAGATLFKTVEKLPQGKKLAELFTEAQNQHNECYIKLESNINVMGKVLSDKIKSATAKLEETSKKIAITLDDALHADQNLRLMQYQEIVLKLYNSQSEIKQTLTELTDKYNELQIENEKLSKKIVEYRINMQTLACSSEYLK